MYVRRYSNPPTAEQKLQAQVDSIAFQRSLFDATQCSFTPFDSKKFRWSLADNAVWHIRDAKIPKQYIGPDFELAKKIHAWFIQTEERAATRWSPELVDTPASFSCDSEVITIKPNSKNVSAPLLSNYLWPTPLFAWIAVSATLKNEYEIRIMKDTLLVSNGMCDIVLFGVRNCNGHNPLQFARSIQATTAIEFLLPFYPEEVKQTKEKVQPLGFQEILVCLAHILSLHEPTSRERYQKREAEECKLWTQMTAVLTESKDTKDAKDKYQNDVWQDSTLTFANTLVTFSDKITDSYPSPLFAAIYLGSQQRYIKELFHHLETTGGMSTYALQSKNAEGETPLRFALKQKCDDALCDLFPRYTRQDQLQVLDDIMNEFDLKRLAVVNIDRTRHIRTRFRRTPLPQLNVVMSDELWSQWMKHRIDAKTILLNYLGCPDMNTHMNGTILHFSKLLLRLLRLIHPDSSLFDHLIYVAKTLSNLHFQAFLLLPEIRDVMNCKELVSVVLSRVDDATDHMKILLQRLSVPVLEQTWRCPSSDGEVHGTILHHILMHFSATQSDPLIDIMALRELDIVFMVDGNGKTPRQLLITAVLDHKKHRATIYDTEIRLSVLEELTAQRHSQVMEQVWASSLPKHLQIKDLIVSIADFIIASPQALITGNFDRQLILQGLYH